MLNYNLVNIPVARNCSYNRKKQALDQYWGFECWKERVREALTVPKVSMNGAL